MYIVNGKSDRDPNPGYGYGNLASIKYLTFPGGNAAESAKLTASNQYQFQLEHATLVSAQGPEEADLGGLTSQVAKNNAYSVAPSASDAQVMQFLHSKIQHIIYVVKENRTFDQILGDLGNGSDGDPSLTLFGKLVTPSFHRMAEKFVTLDNFMDPGDGSMDGWSWSMRGRVTNTETITQQENYARVNRGLSYEGEGQNRNIPSNLSTVAARDFFFDPTGATTTLFGQHRLFEKRHGQHTGERRRPCNDGRSGGLSARLCLQRGAKRGGNDSQLRLDSPILPAASEPSPIRLPIRSRRA